MLWVRIRQLFLVLLFGVCGLAQALPGASTRASVDRLFEFHNGFWINLHHFLYRQAVLSDPQQASRTAPLTKEDQGELGRLSTSERQVWNDAVSYYRISFAKRDLLFDDGLVATKNQLEEADDSSDLAKTEIPAELRDKLLEAAPIYRKHWWTRHEAENLEWITQLRPLIEHYGSKTSSAMERIYSEPWPGHPVRVDVVVYANWAGAYTSVDPTRPTISSADAANQGVAGLEIVFHETSHGMMDDVMAAFRMAEATIKSRQPGRAFQSGSLWHAVLFYTAGELLQEQIEGYVPYADKNGLWARAWPEPDRALIAQDWKPHIDGAVGLQEAVSRLVGDVAASSK